MSVEVKDRMTADEFLPWAEAQEGRRELQDGALVSISPERLLHTETKGQVYSVLRAALARAGAPREFLPSGAAVRINENKVFDLDALVYRRPRLAPDAIEVPEPVIVVEILSPATAARDHGVKFTGYFSLRSLVHYLILDPDRRVLIHHRRGQGDVIETRILTDGVVRLDPPGVEASVETLFAER